MAITQAMCTSFKQELLKGEHDFQNDTFKIALYTSLADLGASTTAYTSTNEVVGVGYVAGGMNLGSASITVDGTQALVSFANATWADSTITARGALIYNASNSNKAVAVFSFGSDMSSSNGNFTAIMPAAQADSALIRI